jgi:hypothetical protein
MNKATLSAEKTVKFDQQMDLKNDKNETSSFGTDSEFEDSSALKTSKGRTNLFQSEEKSDAGSHISKIKRN